MLADKTKLILLIRIALTITLVAVLLWLTVSYTPFNGNVEEQERKLAVFQYLIFSISACIAYAAAYCLTFKNVRIEMLSAGLGLFLGLLYMWVIAPVSVTDEYVHYKSAYQLSNYLLLKENKTEFEADYIDFDDFTFQINTKEAYIATLDKFNDKCDTGETVNEDVLGSVKSMFYWVEYIPATIGVVLGRLLDLNFIRTFMLGRVCCLLFYVLCLYIAVKEVPRFKLLMGFVGLMPMALQEGSIISYDCFINGMSFIVAALMMKSACDEGAFTKREFCRIAVPMVLLAPAKGAYTILILMFLLIPKERFGGRKKKTLYFLIMLLLCATNILLSAMGNVGRILAEENSAQKAMILSLPEIIKRVFYTSYKNAEIYMLCTVGYALSGLSLPVSIRIIYSFVAMLLMAMINDSQQCNPVRFNERAVYLLICTGIVAAFQVAMLFVQSDITQIEIGGVQGRYFIPCIALFLIVFSIKIPKFKWDLWKPLMFGWATLSSITVYKIVIRTLFP